MASRRVLRSVLRNFLGTYVSRYSDLDGHLVFGLAPETLDGLDVDLTAAEPAPSLDPVREIHRLAVRRFAEQLAKARLSRSSLRSARLRVRPLAEAREQEAATAGREPSARTYVFSVETVTDLGRSDRAELGASIAPFDPARFSRSARRGWVGADANATSRRRDPDAGG
jgi:hypothetical protein